jgi:hypothetical protein
VYCLREWGEGERKRVFEFKVRWLFALSSSHSFSSPPGIFQTLAEQLQPYTRKGMAAAKNEKDVGNRDKGGKNNKGKDGKGGNEVMSASQKTPIPVAVRWLCGAVNDLLHDNKAGGCGVGRGQCD